MSSPPFLKRSHSDPSSKLKTPACLTSQAAAHSASLEAKLFGDVWQKPNLAPEELASLEQASPFAAAPRFRPSLAEETRDMDFVWVDITPDKLGILEDLDLLKALDARNKGMMEKVPGWLKDGLAKVAGPVEWLVKGEFPLGIKKGRKLMISVNGVESVATYEGSEKSTRPGQVFAMQAKVNKMAGREFVWVHIAGAHLEPLSQLEIMRGLERRNHGVKDDVPLWLEEGLAHLNTVDWLLQTKLPTGVTRGQKVQFKLNDVWCKAVYNGDPSQAATHNVFALLGSGSLPGKKARSISR